MTNQENGNVPHLQVDNSQKVVNESSHKIAMEGLDNNTFENNLAIDDPEVSKQKLFQQVSNFFEYDPVQHEIDDEFGFADPADPPTAGCNAKYLQWKVRRFVEHFSVRILTSLFIIIDMIILIVDISNNKSIHNDPLEYTSLAFSIYFMIEILLRIFGLGLFYYFAKWYNSLDFVLVVTTLILSIVTVFVENMKSSPANLLIILRLIRLLRITRILWQRRHIQTGARQFISQNKRRYQQGGFDLDLTYVTSKIIAMSFPSSGKWSLYRNDIREVSRFLNTKHEARYKVYNLCAEKCYDITYFNGNVERFFVGDHNVPTLEEMLRFSANVSEWLSQDEKNVIAVHCKGGKGRTGTMICVVLIDTGLFNDASHCLGFFGDRRTDKNAGKKFQGVDTPSQSRYVAYYEKVIKNQRKIHETKLLTISGFTIKGIHSVGNGNASDLTIVIRSRESDDVFEAVVGAHKNCRVFIKPDIDEVRIELMNAPKVSSDTKVMFYSKNRNVPKGYENCAFYFWLHTAFIVDNSLELNRHELDNPHKCKTWNTFGAEFQVTVHFKDGIQKH